MTHRQNPKDQNIMGVKGESLGNDRRLRASREHLSSWLEGIPKSPLLNFLELSSIFSCTVTRGYAPVRNGYYDSCCCLRKRK